MATLEAARAELATKVGALAYVPEVIDPPCVVLEPGEPYLTYEGAENFAYDTFIATMTVYVLVPSDDNEAMARDLDAQIVGVLDQIENAGWVPSTVGKPDTFATSEWNAYGVPITVKTRVSRS